MIIYTVKNGDTFYSIAREFGVTVAELERFNGLPNPEQLVVGQDVLIPTEGNIHTVERGESLYSIASSEGITLSALINANPDLQPPYIIYPGQIINLPQAAIKRTIAVNGYAYPDINRETLNKTLPFLTYLAIFSHRVNQDGTLGEIDDSELIRIAKNGKVAPIMVITNTEKGGGFSSETAESILSNQNVQQTLITNIVNTALRKGYLGVDVDFEYIYPKDLQNYNSFLSALKTQLDRNGLRLSTAVAPKISATQQGTLYEAHDYAFHGKVADKVIIMTYEWGYLYGPPMAVSPYPEVKKVLSYAVTEIPSKKILMGSPNYGYDWTLPYVSGRPARILSINRALSLAYEVGAEIQFSERSKAPFYEYSQNGVDHIVWFENPRSIAARLSLINDFSLGGVSFWTVNQLYLQGLRVVDDMFNIEKVI